MLALREGLEAALVIGIILITLVQTRRQYLIKSVLSGTITGFVSSIILGICLFIGIGELNNHTKELVLGGIQLIAAGLIFNFIIWLSNQQINITDEIKERISTSRSSYSLFLLALFSVVREGFELIIFILSRSNNQSTEVLIETALGIIAAVLIAYILFKTSINLNLKWIYTILGIVLIYVGSQLFSEGLYTFFDGSKLEQNLAIFLYILASIFILLFNHVKSRFK